MASYAERRDSTSSETSSIRLPRVHRASITTPCITTASITTQNAIHGTLAAPRSPERATDILSKMFLAPVLGAIGQKGAPDVLRHHMMMGGGRGERPMTADSQRSAPEMEDSRSDCYFSFPSFENWDETETKDDEPRDVFG